MGNIEEFNQEEEFAKAAVKEIEGIKAKIKEIYYIQEFNRAEEFEKKLRDIQSKYFSDKILYETYQAFIKEIVDLAWEIDGYMGQYGENKKKQVIVANFSRKIKDFIASSKEKNSEQLIAELKEISQTANKQNLGETFIYQLNGLSARALLCTFVKQIKNNEPIDLELIEDLTTPEIFTNEIQEQLIKMAKQKDENIASEILELCQQVKPDALQQEKIWRILSDSDSVKFKEKENQMQPPIEAKKETEMIAVQPKKLSIFEKFKDKFFPQNEGTTKYVFRQLNKETGQYENIEEYHCFPPKGRLLRKCRGQCVELEINDYKYEIDMAEFMDEMPYLRSLTFGRKCSIIINTLEKRDCMKFLQEVKFGEDVTEIRGIEVFAGCVNLESIEMGNSLESIGDACFRMCKSLKEVKLPNSVVKIGDMAFERCSNLENVEMGNRIQTIGKRLF